MSIKTKLVTAILVAGVAGVAGVCAAALPAAPAGAATGHCGSRCVDIFSRGAGTYRHPTLVLDVLRQVARADQPVVLFPASRKDPAEDFAVDFQSRVSDLYRAGLVNPWLAKYYGGLGCQKYRAGGTGCLKHYPDDHVYEIEYAPLGVGSGLCVGLRGIAGDGTPVSLQTCGVSARTIWVADVPNSTGRSLFHYYAPLINGTQDGGSPLDLLTYPGRSRQLVTRPLQRCGCQQISTRQQWGAGSGALR